MGGPAKKVAQAVTAPVAFGNRALGRVVTDAITPDMPDPTPPPPPPQRSDTDVQETAEEERQRDAVRARQARRSTILTSPLGVTGGEPQTRRKSLLGQ